MARFGYETQAPERDPAEIELEKARDVIDNFLCTPGNTRDKVLRFGQSSCTVEDLYLSLHDTEKELSERNMAKIRNRCVLLKKLLFCDPNLLREVEKVKGLWVSEPPFWLEAAFHGDPNNNSFERPDNKKIKPKKDAVLTTIRWLTHILAVAIERLLANETSNHAIEIFGRVRMLYDQQAVADYLDFLQQNLLSADFTQLGKDGEKEMSSLKHDFVVILECLLARKNIRHGVNPVTLHKTLQDLYSKMKKTKALVEEKQDGRKQVLPVPQDPNQIDLENLGVKNQNADIILLNGQYYVIQQLDQQKSQTVQPQPQSPQDELFQFSLSTEQKHSTEGDHMYTEVPPQPPQPFSPMSTTSEDVVMSDNIPLVVPQNVDEDTSVFNTPKQWSPTKEDPIMMFGDKKLADYERDISLQQPGPKELDPDELEKFFEMIVNQPEPSTVPQRMTIESHSPSHTSQQINFSSAFTASYDQPLQTQVKMEEEWQTTTAMEIDPFCYDDQDLQSFITNDVMLSNASREVNTFTTWGEVDVFQPG